LRIGYIFTGTPPLVGASSGVGVAAGGLLTYSKANCPQEFNGWSGTFGGSGGIGPVGGFDIGNVGSQYPLTWNAFGGVGLMDSPELALLPAEGHATASYTHADSISIGRILDWFP